MSIPLDRLYIFLQDHCDRNVLIYRFTPHGSKKPTDLRMLSCANDVADSVALPEVVFHDQELLDFESWEHHPTPFLIPGVPHSKIKAYTDHFNIHDKLLLVHSEKNSEELKKFEDDGAIGVYYWSHAIIARDWFRYAQHDLALTKHSEKSKRFLIYNRAWSGTREYRLKFFELLLQHNLQYLCSTSFNPTDAGLHYTNHAFKNPSLQISNFGMEHAFPLNTYPSHASADYEVGDYANTDIEVVLETIFDESRLHITEKTLRPIALGHPFILCAPAGSLGYLQQYGFKTFSDCWDESYDTIVDPVERLNRVISVMKQLESSDVNQDKIKHITSYNKALFFSQRFHDQIIHEFKQNLNAGLAELDQTISGKYFIRDHELKRSANYGFPDTVKELYKKLTR